MLSAPTPTPQAFATPKRHHKSKPFFDHVISFSVAGEAGGHTWQSDRGEGVGSMKAGVT